jgi:hypothetical protein
MTTKPITPPVDTTAHANQAAVLPAVPQEPSAGGNYLRDPVTGALSPNPGHTIAEEPQE